MGLLPRVVFRESRCPGCHGRVSLKYEVRQAGDGSYRYHLLSPSIGHRLCVEALAEIRRGIPEDAGRGRPRRGDAKTEVQEASKVYGREVTEGEL